MHTEVFNNIDTLIEMAGASSNIDEKNAELITLKRQIRNKANEIEDLKSIISDARYFNASNELVDKNIEISLKNKIGRLTRKLKEVEEKITEISVKESTLHDEIKTLKKKLAKNEKYVGVLEEKASTSSANEYYQNLLKEEKENVAALTALLEEKNNEHENIIKELELNNQAAREIKDKLTSEETRLNDILDNLKNPNAYIDEDLKASDEEKLKNLNKELENLEKRELEIITDAGVIGMDAKELIAGNQIEEAITKIKELVTIVKTKPYMDINNDAILDEELEKKESLRVELSNLIDSKNYEGIDSEAIKGRIEYLNKEIVANNEEIGKLENESNQIDEFINNTLGKKITALEKEIMQNAETIKGYKEILKAKENNAKTKVNLEQAITKKEKESQVLDNILVAYKDDLLNKINNTNELNKKVEQKKEINNRYEKELEGLQKITLINFQTKDLIEEEKDKEELKKLNEEVKQIKNRKKYEKTPNEIYDQIEMLLASYAPTKTLREEKNKNKTLEIDSLFEDTKKKEEKVEESTNNRIKVIEMIPVETVKKKSGGNE